MPANRQLAAILFTDIEGYTALMQQDEQKAITVKDRHREIFQKAHHEYNGQIIRYYGDGTLSIFHSAVHAVKCAIAMQQAYSRWPKIPVRMGLHIGDITIQDDDIFGDGVNIASRLESLGVAGSVLVSDKVKNEINNHPEIKIVSAGIYHFKNAERPMEVFAIVDEYLVIPKPQSLKGKTEEKKTPLSNRIGKMFSRNVIIALIAIVVLITGGYFFFKSANKKEKPQANSWLAVLPFRLISGDSSLEWLSDGFTEELTSSLAGISGLKVKSSTTMLHYRNASKTTKQIAKELNLGNLIDGNLQQSGNYFIINARLINPLTDEIIENFKFKKEASEIKAVYSEFAQQVADILAVTITNRERKRLQQTIIVDPELYNLYLQGIYYLKKLSHEDIVKALGFFEKALEKNPAYPPALVGKASVFQSFGWSGAMSREEVLQQSSSLLEKAIAIDSNLSFAYSTFGWRKMNFEWDFSGAEQYFLKAYYLDPGDDMAISGLIFSKLCAGKFDEALTWWETGNAISPQSWWIDSGHGEALYYAGKTNEAISHLKEYIGTYGHFVFYDRLGWVYHLNGQYHDAIDILQKEIAKFEINLPSTMACLAISYFQTGNRSETEKITRALEKMVTEKKQNTSTPLATVYLAMGEKNKALQMLDTAYRRHDLDMIWLKVDPHFKPLHNEVHYQELLKQIGFDQ